DSEPDEYHSCLFIFRADGWFTHKLYRVAYRGECWPDYYTVGQPGYLAMARSTSPRWSANQMVNVHHSGLHLGSGSCAALRRDAGLGVVAEHSLWDDAHLVSNGGTLRASRTECVVSSFGGDAEAVAFEKH